MASKRGPAVARPASPIAYFLHAGFVPAALENQRDERLAQGVLSPLYAPIRRSRNTHHVPFLDSGPPCVRKQANDPLVSLVFPEVVTNMDMASSIEQGVHVSHFRSCLGKGSHHP
jgi:hypothetical protein